MLNQFLADNLPALLNPSGAAEADRHCVAVDDHRNVAAALGMGQHPLEVLGVLLHVHVFERHTPPFVVLTGGRGVGSGVLAEDVDHGDLLGSMITDSGLGIRSLLELLKPWPLFQEFPVQVPQLQPEYSLVIVKN